MAKMYPGITAKLAEFIADQKIFFVGNAAHQGRVNISPKDMDSLYTRMILKLKIQRHRTEQ